jgi:hypothetical protein
MAAALFFIIAAVFAVLVGMAGGVKAIIPFALAAPFVVLFIWLGRLFIRRRNPGAVGRFFLWAFVALFSYTVYALIWNEYGRLRINLLEYSIRKAEETARDLRAKDTYGGKTPQETYEMYLDALKKGDIELASRYYVRKYQESGRKSLQRLKEIGSYERWVASRPEWNNFIEISKGALPNKRWYEYPVIFTEPIVMSRSDGSTYTLGPERSGTSTMIFELIPESGIWKID